MNILVTAGPTREFLDPVRFISNRSTGRMGFAIAQAGVEQGHQVTLVCGPVVLETPDNVRRVDVVTACEMLAAVEQELAVHDALVMSAAVGDWRPAEFSEAKLKKNTMPANIKLLPNPDILRTIAPLKGKRIFVGFAAETHDLAIEATRKLHEKGLDMVVANDITTPDAGFAVETNRVVLFTPEALPQALPLQSKLELGHKLINWIEERYLEKN